MKSDGALVPARLNCELRRVGLVETGSGAGALETAATEGRSSGLEAAVVSGAPGAGGPLCACADVAGHSAQALWGARACSFLVRMCDGERGEAGKCVTCHVGRERQV